MRTRLQDGKGGPYYAIQLKNKNNGYMGSDTTCMSFADTGWTGEYLYCEDMNNAPFRTRMDRGDMVLTACDIIKRVSTIPQFETLKFGPHRWSQWPLYPWTAELTGGIAGYLLHFVPVPLPKGVGKLREVTLIAAFAEMNRAPVMGGEILGTLNLTLKMLKKPLGTSIELLKDIHKRRRFLSAKKKAWTEMRCLSQAWLETRYGWTPLFQDVADITAAAEKARDNVGKRRLVARSKQQMENEMFVSDCDGPQIRVPGTSAAKFRTVAKHGGSVSSGVVYDIVVDGSISGFARSLGLSADSIPATLWELTPWSFVADWFLNIGDWLSAVTPVPGISPRGHWTTVVTRSSNFISDGTVTIDRPTPSASYQAGFKGGTINEFRMTRTVNPSLPRHPLWLGKPLSTLQIVDAVSLSIGQAQTRLAKVHR